MKKIGLMLLAVIMAIIFIPLIVMKGIGPGVKVNGVNPGGVINFDLEDKNSTETVPEQKGTEVEESTTGTAELKLKVYNVSKKQVQEIELEDYIMGVVAGEMPVEFESEALKAQAVAARTYAVTRMKSFGGAGCKSHPEVDICTDSHCCQAWILKEDIMKRWEAADALNYWDKIFRAVNDTRGMMLTYDAAPVMYPLYFSTSSGKTENSQDVYSSQYPYLRSVTSPNEDLAPKYTTKVTMTSDEFVKKFSESQFKIKLDKAKLPSQVKILSRTEGGSVKSIQLGNKTLKGTDVRAILDLNSANFNIQYSNSNVIITVLGNGHGVGMSQWGANIMAKSGSKYEDILKHYYTGVEIGKIDMIYSIKQGV